LRAVSQLLAAVYRAGENFIGLPLRFLFARIIPE
jgi:hypothetical protein